MNVNLNNINLNLSVQELHDQIKTEGKEQGLTDKQIAGLLLKLDELIEQHKADHELFSPNGRFNGTGLGRGLGDASANLQADIYSFMALFQKFAQQMRQTERMDRQTSLQAQASALGNAADKMRESAEKRFTSAVISGAFQIGGGAVAAGMSVASGIQSVKSANLTHQAGESTKYSIDPSLDEFARGGQHDLASRLTVQAQHASTVAQNLSSGSQAITQIGDGSGKIAGGALEREAGHADAARADRDAEAKIHEAAQSKANEMMQAMQDIIRDIREKLAAIEQSNIEANRGIARNV